MYVRYMMKPITVLKYGPALTMPLSAYGMYHPSSFFFAHRFLNNVGIRFCSQNLIEKRNKFQDLHLRKGLIEGLTSFKISKPTEIQHLGIPKILSRNNVLLAAETGSGKTLAFLLPLIQLLHQDERKMNETEFSQEKRPRALVLAPTRELSQQAYDVCRSFRHHARLRCVSLSTPAGSLSRKQMKRNMLKTVDCVFTTPGALWKFRQQDRIYLSKVQYVVIDEADVLCHPKSNFLKELEQAIAPIFHRIKKEKERKRSASKLRTVQFILASASLSTRTLRFLAKPDGLFPNLIPVLSKHVHQLVNNLSQTFIQAKGRDKQHVLRDIIEHEMKEYRANADFRDKIQLKVMERDYMAEEQVQLLIGADWEKEKAKKAHKDVNKEKRKLKALHKRAIRWEKRAERASKRVIMLQIEIKEIKISGNVEEIKEKEEEIDRAIINAKYRKEKAESIKYNIEEAKEKIEEKKIKSYEAKEKANQAAITANNKKNNQLTSKDQLQNLIFEKNQSSNYVTRARLDPTIIFCNTIPSCRSTELFLVQHGVRAVGYHKQIPPAKREIFFNMFKRSKCDIMVCTDIASRGLDMTHVKHVIIFDFPIEASDYLHRVGRTARAGMAGRSTSIIANKKEQKLATYIQRANENKDNVLQAFKSENNPKNMRMKKKRNFVNSQHRTKKRNFVNTHRPTKKQEYAAIRLEIERNLAMKKRKEKLKKKKVAKEQRKLRKIAQKDKFKIPSQFLNKY